MNKHIISDTIVEPPQRTWLWFKSPPRSKQVWYVVSGFTGKARLTERYDTEAAARAAVAGNRKSEEHILGLFADGLDQDPRAQLDESQRAALVTAARSGDAIVTSALVREYLPDTNAEQLLKSLERETIFENTHRAVLGEPSER